MKNLDKHYVRETQDRQIKLWELGIRTLDFDDGSGEPRVREASFKELWAVELRSKESIQEKIWSEPRRHRIRVDQVTECRSAHL